MFQDWLSDRASEDTGTRLAVKVQFGLEPWKGYGDWIGVTYIGSVPMVDRERGHRVKGLRTQERRVWLGSWYHAT